MLCMFYGRRLIIMTTLLTPFKIMGYKLQAVHAINYNVIIHIRPIEFDLNDQLSTGIS